MMLALIPFIQVFSFSLVYNTVKDKDEFDFNYSFDLFILSFVTGNLMTINVNC